MISLVAIVRNCKDNIKRLIETHKDLVSEIIIVDQSSTDGTKEEAEKLGAVVFTRSNKGSSEHDREFAFSLAKNKYILYLDDDEYLSEEAKDVVKKVVTSPVNVVLFRRKNIIDGIESTILGKDYQARLWTKGSLNWPTVLHMHPDKPYGALCIYTEAPIVHERTFARLKAAQKRRNPNTHKEIAAMQDKYLEEVEKELSRKVSE